jgi:hypothetical protein
MTLKAKTLLFFHHHHVRKKERRREREQKRVVCVLSELKGRFKQGFSSYCSISMSKLKKKR